MQRALEKMSELVTNEPDSVIYVTVFVACSVNISHIL